MRDAPAYQLFMLALSVLALLTIVIQNTLRLDPHERPYAIWRLFPPGVSE